MFCSDSMSGSHFILQTSKFLLIDAAAVTLGLGHRKIIQSISPDSYILCAKYLWFSSNSFDVRGKCFCSSGRGGSRRSRNKLKTWSHPRLGWLNDNTFSSCAVTRAGVVVLSTRTCSTRILNSWYSYFTRTCELQSNSTCTCTCGQVLIWVLVRVLI